MQQQIIFRVPVPTLRRIGIEIAPLDPVRVVGGDSVAASLRSVASGERDTRIDMWRSEEGGQGVAELWYPSKSGPRARCARVTATYLRFHGAYLDSPIPDADPADMPGRGRLERLLWPHVHEQEICRARTLWRRGRCRGGMTWTHGDFDFPQAWGCRTCDAGFRFLNTARRLGD